MRVFLEWLMSLNRIQKQAIQAISDSLLMYICFYLAMFVRLETTSFLERLDSLAAITFTIPFAIFTFSKLGLYSAIVRFISSKIILILTQGIVVSAIFLFFIAYIFDLFVPRSVPLIYAFFLISAMYFTRIAARRLFINVAKPKANNKRVAIYGAGITGRQILEGLKSNPAYHPIIFIDDDIKLQNTTIGNLWVTSF